MAPKPLLKRLPLFPAEAPDSLFNASTPVHPGQRHELIDRAATSTAAHSPYGLDGHKRISSMFPGEVLTEAQGAVEAD